MNYRTYEGKGYFYLTEEPDAYSMSDDGDIGTGSAQSITRFQTEAERAYYIRIQEAEERERQRARELTHLKTVVQSMLTPKGRVRRKVLAKLIELTKSP